jgi:hypothetical protein
MDYQILEVRKYLIFLGNDEFAIGYFPIDFQVGIVIDDSRLGLWVVVIIALVKEGRRIA